MHTLEDSQEPTGGVGLYFSGKSSNIAMVIGYQGCHSRGLQSLHWKPTEPTVIAFAQGPELHATSLWVTTAVTAPQIWLFVVLPCFLLRGDM